MRNIDTAWTVTNGNADTRANWIADYTCMNKVGGSLIQPPSISTPVLSHYIMSMKLINSLFESTYKNSSQHKNKPKKKLIVITSIHSILLHPAFYIQIF